MTEKRYFSIDYDEEYYIFDSTKISKEEVLEKAEYSYDVFGDSLMENEVLDLLNENEQLKKDIEYLDEKIKENEWHWNTIDEDRDVWHYKCTQAEKRVKELKTENEQLKQFKELLCAVLKQEYEDRTNEMNMWAEKEDWNGYRATKFEYGTVIRIAKRIGVDLE